MIIKEIEVPNYSFMSATNKNISKGIMLGFAINQLKRNGQILDIKRQKKSGSAHLDLLLEDGFIGKSNFQEDIMPEGHSVMDKALAWHTGGWGLNPDMTKVYGAPILLGTPAI